MRNILLGSLFIVVASVTAPHYLTDRLGERADAGPIAPSAEASVAVSAASGRAASIRAEDDGHFYVQADVNFRPVRLMVDTGASVVALRESDAASAGIRVFPADFTAPVATANGVAYAAETELDSVMIADVEVSGVRALVLPDDQLGVSLLGGSFLNRLSRFEVTEGTLVLEE